jgi:hypothetical protein
MTQTELRKADANYKQFPLFADWAALRFDSERWNRALQLLREAKATAPEPLARALDLVRSLVTTKKQQHQPVAHSAEVPGDWVINGATVPTNSESCLFIRGAVGNGVDAPGVWHALQLPLAAVDEPMRRSDDEVLNGRGDENFTG